MSYLDDLPVGCSDCGVRINEYHVVDCPTREQVPRPPAQPVTVTRTVTVEEWAEDQAGIYEALTELVPVEHRRYVFTIALHDEAGQGKSVADGATHVTVRLTAHPDQVLTS